MFSISPKTTQSEIPAGRAAASLDLHQAQFRSFAVRMPPLYAAVGISVLAQILIFHHRAPWQVAVAAPLALFTFAVALGWMLYRDYRRLAPGTPVMPALRRTAAMVALGAVSATAMDSYLFSVGDIDARYFIIFKLFSFGMCAYVCLIHLPRLAIFTVAVVVAPCSVMFAWIGGPIGFTGCAIVWSVALMLVVSARGYFTDFARLVHSRHDIERLGAENARLASLDMLTDLPNRRHFFAALSAELARARQEGGAVAVGIVDLDGFKPINDTYGHPVGDRVLSLVAARLVAATPLALEMSRIGGDEFAFLVRGPAGGEALEQIGERIIDSLKDHFVVDEIVTSLGCSLGFSVSPDGAASGVELFEQADFALYHAKRTGRARSVVFSGEHRAYLASQGAIEQALRTADMETEFYPVFQPIVDSATGEIRAFEALSRWNSPALGPVSPGEFIPVAERSGLISAISLHMFRKALACMREWPETLSISFNLSAYDIASPATVMQFLSIVGTSGVNPGRISFEVTESGLLKEFDVVGQHIEAIKNAGMKVALDDFGTGYSSLAYVNRLPFDKLKIDRSFVADLETNVSSQNIVRSVIALCRDMKIDCIAEGAETQAQISALSALGCRNIQGYYYSRPLEAGGVLDFLRKKLMTVAP